MASSIPEGKLLRIIDNLMRSSSLSGKIEHTDFLDAATAEALFSYSSKRFEGQVVLSGGKDSAERKLIIFLPHGEPAEAAIDRLIALVEIVPADPKLQLSHRDYLGAIMAAGLSRAKLGDITITQKGAQAFATPAAAKILTCQLERVGQTRVSVEIINLNEAECGRETAPGQTLSVSSLRLDCVVAAGFRLARSKAAQAITGGLISLNWQPALKPDEKLAEGDMIGFRGRGRARLKSIGGLSRKGHTFITLEIMGS